MRSAGWTQDELQRIGASEELEIAVRRADGSQGRWVPIWVVRVDDGVYVRTWYRRENGWFGHVLRSQRASIRVAGVLADVSVADVGDDSAELRSAVDAAYRAKYLRGGVDQMISDSAAATTLQLRPLTEET